jgi:5,10-methylenetetrahydromethanopterin reductase
VSRGRAILGLGIGHKEDLEDGHGVAFGQPFERMREYVTLIRAILRGDRLPVAPLCRVSRFQLAFSPERRTVPIYLAALGPRMCELAGEIADGVLLNWATPGYVEHAVSRVRIGAERAHRDASAVDIACYLRTAVSGDPLAAEQALARQLTDYIAMDVYRRMLEESGFADDTAAVVRALPEGVAVAARKVSDRLLAAVTVAGSDTARHARLEEYRRAGVTQPVMAPVAVGDDPFESWAMTLDAFAPLPHGAPPADDWPR